MKRYKAISFEYDDEDGMGTALDIIEHNEGEFVKYDDIKHLLERSDNSDYAVTPSALPKLPPERICHHIQPIQDYAKKLNYTKCPVCGGNFT